MSTQTISTPTSADLRAKIGTVNAQLAAAKSCERQGRFAAAVFHGLKAAGHPHADRLKDAPLGLEIATENVRQLEQDVTGLTFAAEYLEYVEALAAEAGLAAQIGAASEQMAQYDDVVRLENRLAVEYKARQIGATPMKSAADQIDAKMRARIEAYHAARSRLEPTQRRMQQIADAKERAVRVCSQVGDLLAILPTSGDPNSNGKKV
jgi:hypothetical protein